MWALAVRNADDELAEHAGVAEEKMWQWKTQRPRAPPMVLPSASGRSVRWILKVSVYPGGMSMLSLNSAYGHVNVGAPAFVRLIGCIEKPWRWYGWCAAVVLVTSSWRMSPTLA
jgi:hypothetical protein